MPGEAYRDAVQDFKREFLARQLAARDGNRTATAQALGMTRTYLVRLIRTLRVPCAPGQTGWARASRATAMRRTDDAR